MAPLLSDARSGSRMAYQPRRHTSCHGKSRRPQAGANWRRLRQRGHDSAKPTEYTRDSSCKCKPANPYLKSPASRFPAGSGNSVTPLSPAWGHHKSATYLQCAGACSPTLNTKHVLMPHIRLSRAFYSAPPLSGTKVRNTALRTHCANGSTRQSCIVSAFLRSKTPTDLVITLHGAGDSIECLVFVRPPFQPTSHKAHETDVSMSRLEQVTQVRAQSV